MKINCLPVEVYRARVLGDCTNNGVSKFFDELLVYCPDGHRSFDGEKEIPLNFCCIVERDGYIYIVPAMIAEDGRIVARGRNMRHSYRWMYGGNIASTSDSRFYGMCGHYYPLHIHDRREW